MALARTPYSASSSNALRQADAAKLGRGIGAIPNSLLARLELIWMITPLFLALHHPNRVFGAEKVAGEIHIHDQLPVAQVHLIDGAGAHDAGVGDRMSSRPNSLTTASTISHLLLVRHIHRQRNGAAARLVGTASAVCSACSALRSATTTSHPRASRKQMAAPSPWAPPVTNLARSLNIVSVFPLCSFASLRLRGSLLFLALQHYLQQFTDPLLHVHAVGIQFGRHRRQHRSSSVSGVSGSGLPRFG